MGLEESWGKEPSYVSIRWGWEECWVRVMNKVVWVSAEIISVPIVN